MGEGMRGRTERGRAVAKSPRPSLSPGPMSKYMIQGGSRDNQTMEKQQNTKGLQTEAKEKK